MSIILSSSHKRPQINLDGPEGNVYCLIGYTQSFCRQIGYSKENTQDLVESLFKQTNYVDVIKLFNKNFNGYCDLVTTNQTLYNSVTNSN